MSPSPSNRSTVSINSSKQTGFVGPLLIAVAVFLATTAFAMIVGASNWGTAASFGQIALAIFTSIWLIRGK